MAQNPSNISLPPSITLRRGRKSPNDKIVLFHGYAITLYEYALIGVLIASIDDINYPRERGFDGGERIARYMEECFTKMGVTEKTLKKFQVRPGFSDIRVIDYE